VAYHYYCFIFLFCKIRSRTFLSGLHIDIWGGFVQHKNFRIAISARAIRALWVSPPESWPKGLSLRWYNSIFSRRYLAFSLRVSRVNSHRWTFRKATKKALIPKSVIGKYLSSWDDCGTYPIFERTSSGFFSKTVTLPSLVWGGLLSILKRVVFPPPFGPITPMKPPFSIFKFTSSRRGALLKKMKLFLIQRHFYSLSYSLISKSAKFFRFSA